MVTWSRLWIPAQGPLPIIVPGANSRVEELRGDFLLKDTWSIGNIELDYGLGAEVSNISQTGDVDQERDFVFFKTSIGGDVF